MVPLSLPEEVFCSVAILVLVFLNTQTRAWPLTYRTVLFSALTFGVPCSTLLSVAVIMLSDQTFRKERVSFTPSWQSIIRGSQGRNSRQELDTETTEGQIRLTDSPATVYWEVNKALINSQAIGNWGNYNLFFFYMRCHFVSVFSYHGRASLPLSGRVPLSRFPASLTGNVPAIWLGCCVLT